MNSFVQASLLLGAYISYITARPGAKMLSEFGSGLVNILLTSLVLSLLLFVGLAGHMALALAFSPDPQIGAPNIIMLIASIALVLAGIRAAREVKRQAADAEKKRTVKT